MQTLGRTRHGQRRSSLPVLTAALLFSQSAWARTAEVQVESMSSRIALQRDVGTWLEATLKEFAQPYRLLVTVEFGA